jgi:putative hydrolase of the HAD superfamily
MTQRAPTTILFDADEVIQTWARDYRAMFATLIRQGADVDAFVDDIFAAEAPCLSGHGEVTQRLAPVLAQWESPGTVADVLTIFTTVHTDPHILQIIRDLRRCGVACHLASNQQAHRASYMSHTLGYAQIFDSMFYSCDIGAKKPDPAYFATVLAHLQIDPAHILFIDDRAENVAAARQAGIPAIQFHIASGAAELRRLLSNLGIALATDMA